MCFVLFGFTGYKLLLRPRKRRRRYTLPEWKRSMHRRNLYSYGRWTTDDLQAFYDPANNFIDHHHALDHALDYPFDHTLDHALDYPFDRPIYNSNDHHPTRNYCLNVNRISNRYQRTAIFVDSKCNGCSICYEIVPVMNKWFDEYFV